MSAIDQKKKTGIVVSHTHWDRAWYLTFQQFRHRMVRMIDRLITLLQQNKDYHSFTLDGQTILLDDYLEIKPYNHGVLKNLISSGKMIVGPWYILPDLFLVSGESVVRNLQIGLRTARNYGSAMQEGYVPDPFGHFAQLPQVLSQFGINSFIFMRGLSDLDKSKSGTIFDWQSPDGSKVLTTYLVDGYFNGAALGYPDQYGRFDGLVPDPELAKSRIKEAIKKLEHLQNETVFLINNGFDHMPEQPELPDLLALVNSNGSDTGLKHGTFHDFFTEVRAQNLDHEVIEGDLLGNADHPILSSVFSTRIYLKQQNHKAQSLLEKYTEPLHLWSKFNTNRSDASDFLDYNWKLLLQNHPHDDICGCSTDGVHEDDEVRFRQVRELAESLIVEQIEAMQESGIQPPATTSALSSDIFVYNPHPWPVKKRVHTSILFANPKAEEGDRTPDKALSAIDADGNPVSIHVSGTKAHSIRNNFLETSWGRRYDISFEIDVPAGGYHIVHVYQTDEDAATSPIANRNNATSTATSNKATFTAGNTDLRLSDNSYSVKFGDTGVRFEDFIQFEYQHDNGDTYTFGPVPEAGIFWSKLTKAYVENGDTNTITALFSIDVPRSLSDSETISIPIKTRIELQPDGNIEIAISYMNTAKDGRMRLILPTGVLTKTVLADGHFRLAHRHQINFETPESAPERYKAYPGELEYRTQHMNDFVLLQSDNFTTWIATRGLHEFELINDSDKTSVALTINRSVGLLSTGNGRIRRVQAGPAINVPGAQCLREISATIGVGIENTSEIGSAISAARTFSHPLWVREMPYLPHLKSGDSIPRKNSIIQLDNPLVAISSLRLHPDGVTTVLRMYNLSDSEQTTHAKLGIPVNEWASVDLYERWAEDGLNKLGNNEPISFTLNPHQIVTILLRHSETT